MYKKLIIAVATVLVIVGCNNSSTAKEDLVSIPVSLGAVDNIVVGSEGLTKEVKRDILGTNTDGETVVTASFTIPKGQELRNAQGQATCTTDNPCKISAEQKCKDANEVSPCNEAEWRRLIAGGLDGNIPVDHVVLYSGTIDIEEEDGVLTNCGMTVTIDVPETALWLESTRPSKRHGIGCQIMKVWVTDACENKKGYWVDAPIVLHTCSGGWKTITIQINKLPAHIVMFVTMPENHENLACCTGGSK